MNDDFGESSGPSRPINSLEKANEWAGSKGFSPKSGGIEAILSNLDGYLAHMMERAARAAAEIAVLLSNHAKANHPWTPQSGNTDTSTMGPANWEEVSQGVFEIVLSAGMDYDIFLELARDGKWAWLWPTIEACRGDIRDIIVRNMRV